jgi:uncharacterized protein (TIGR03118 family)
MEALATEGEELGPTGVVFNPSAGFQVSLGGVSASSVFIFATTEGTIQGWSPDVDPRSAVVAIDNSRRGSAYTGLAIADTEAGMRLYAANFSGASVDVYDDTFAPAAGLAPDAFRDPSLPAGYAPFGIQQLDGAIYVAYALQNEEGDEEVPGPGNGFVDVYTLDGALIQRVASGGDLNAPWAMVHAPSGFGPFGGALLIGNFGDGRITAFDRDDFGRLGQLETGPRDPIEIEGLWGLAFGNGRDAGETSELFFAAGIDDETHGLFGTITER